MTTFADALQYLVELGDVRIAFCEPSKRGEPGTLLCMYRETNSDGLRFTKDALVIEDPEMS